MELQNIKDWKITSFFDTMEERKKEYWMKLWSTNGDIDWIGERSLQNKETEKET